MSFQPRRLLPTPKTRMLPVWKLQGMLDEQEMIMDAPYQRGIVWELDKMSELIDSILNNYYVPPVVLAVRTVKNKPHRIVIDGKQRLTSASRFYRNLIPYTDTSSGTPLDRYYGEQYDDHVHTPEEEILKKKQKPQNFLTPELLEIFNRFEFVCVEYTDITEDDEYDIFSRVQLGKVLTPADRLKAHNTPRAQLCRQHMRDYSLLSKLFQRSLPPQLFQLFIQILYLINLTNPRNFNVSTKHITEFVSSREPVPPESKEKLLKVLTVYKQFATNEEYRNTVIRVHNKVVPLRSLEILVFSKFITLVQRPRSTSQFADDLVRLRTFLQQEREGKLYVGKESITEGYRWIEDYLDSHYLRAVSRPQPIYQLDSEDDELKDDEYEPEVELPLKRIREERNLRGLAVARRGGKSAAKFKRLQT